MLGCVSGPNLGGSSHWTETGMWRWGAGRVYNVLSVRETPVNTHYSLYHVKKYMIDVI